MSSYGPNRYVCSALEEMRDQLKLLNHFTIGRYKKVTALMIEEVQTLVNRMESALGDWDDLQKLTDKRRKLKIEVRALEAKKGWLSPDDKDENE